MIKTFVNATNLPKQWDSLVGDNIYMTIDFLTFLERVSTLPMHYHCIYDKEHLDSIFVTFYKRKHNIGMFSKKDFFLPVTLFYVPLSIAQPGVIIGKEKKQFDDYYKKTKGCKLILNVASDFSIQGFAQGFTCPQCILDLKWKSFDDYLCAMRSNYRYRYNKALKKSQDLILRRLDSNSNFSEEMLAQYLEVYENSKFQVEKLTKDFFKSDTFVILVLENKDGKTLGFIQLLHNKKELVFEFIGFDHSQNKQFDLYIRLLLELVRYGIEKGFEKIDFGQTADEAKLKLGCRYNYLYAVIGHSNSLMNSLIKRKVRKLEYNFIKQNYNIFKE